MPSVKFDSKAEFTQFEMLPDGDYPFEIVAVDFALSTGNKTNGSETMECKVAFFRDKAFEKKAAQWTETFIFHPSTEWKLSVFTKCANMLVNGKVPADGEEIEYTEATVKGLRGWASVRNKAGTQDKEKRFNYVAAWITNKEKLPRNTPAPIPFSEPVKSEEEPW
ncbi:MAG TPA: hypothetical protein VEH04_08205 [Verrucomicrobiae bacterium]|nr:hypothetical protein [Verrucomicrobiae bacterium]